MKRLTSLTIVAFLLFGSVAPVFADDFGRMLLGAGIGAVVDKRHRGRGALIGAGVAYLASRLSSRSAYYDGYNDRPYYMNGPYTTPVYREPQVVYVQQQVAVPVEVAAMNYQADIERSRRAADAAVEASHVSIATSTAAANNSAVASAVAIASIAHSSQRVDDVADAAIADIVKKKTLKKRVAVSGRDRELARMRKDP